MAHSQWTWKGKDGSSGKLLYEPGNWGDILKNLWLTILVSWMREDSPSPLEGYNDFFAGAPQYPLAEKTRLRFTRIAFPEFYCIKEPYINKRKWPSSASTVRLLCDVIITLYEKDPIRMEQWQDVPAVKYFHVDSGWEALSGVIPRAADINMVDPYDILAEWREILPCLNGKFGKTTLLIYVYNKSALNKEAFDNYRAFRNAVVDATQGLATCFGRIASDPFLPRAHHEMWLLPEKGLADSKEYVPLTERLAEKTHLLNQAQKRFAEFDFI
jgi:hypothetical protein